MWRVLVMAFLFLHGVIQGLQATGSSESWLVADRRWQAAAMTLTAAALCIAAGVGVWGHAGWWRPTAVIGAVLSLVYFTIFLTPYILFGMALDMGLIVALGWRHWLTVSMVEA